MGVYSRIGYFHTNSRKISLQMSGLHGVVRKVKVARDQTAVGACLPQCIKHRVKLCDAQWTCSKCTTCQQSYREDFTCTCGCARGKQKKFYVKMRRDQNIIEKRSSNREKTACMYANAYTITRRAIEMHSGKRHRVSANQKLTNQNSPRIPRGHFVNAQLCKLKCDDVRSYAQLNTHLCLARECNRTQLSKEQ